MVEINYLTYQQIDKAKWDACIHASENGLLYACSSYLDCMAPSWDALVFNDYEMIMPLPVRIKWGIPYIFQPSITPALGVFGNKVTPEIINTFIKAIPSKFKLLDISFNCSNKVQNNHGTIVTRNNYVLKLNDNYDCIRQNYSENIRRNIAKAIKNNCVLKKNIAFDEVVVICKKSFPGFTKVETGLFDKLRMVYDIYKADSESYGVFTNEGALLASCIFLSFKNRAYYWLVGNTPQSKQYGASSFLLDTFIKDHAGKNILLDFEGSDEKSVADFYKKFGSIQEPFYTLFLNKLPFPLNLLKPLPQHYRKLILK
jgi:hypothetical protein